MKAAELSQQQGLRLAQLAEDYRVVGGDGLAPPVREPTGQVPRVQPNGRPTAATMTAKRGPADPGADQPARLAGGLREATPYTSVWG